jgi:predicted DNA-binding ribbon-helix-helix protein
MTISESAAKKLSHSAVKIFDIVLNRNDVLVQLPPEVSEEVNELGILARRRRINMSTILDEFKNNTFDQIHPNDTLFFGHGVVTSIQVFCNTPEDLEYPYNAQLKRIAEQQRDVYTELLAYLNSKAVKKMTLDDNISFWRRKATEYLNDELKYSYDKREFEGILVRVEVTDSIICGVGSKLSGRYGDKGVVSQILPDHEMPQTEDGRYAEVVRNSLGVNGRLNPSQLFEQEMNYVAEEIHRKAHLIKSEVKGLKKFSEDILRFYEIGCPELFEFAQTLEKEDFDTWMGELFENGNVPIHQPPFFGNASIDSMIQLYTEFNIEKTKFVGIQDKLIFAKLYHIKLKHEPEKKFSARSTGMTSLLDIPYKSNDKYKKGNALFNSNPVKMGEQEYFNMALLGDPEGHSDFLKTYSASNEHRHLMLRDLLANNVEDIDEFTKPEGDVASNSAQTVRATFFGAGIELKPI